MDLVSEKGVKKLLDQYQLRPSKGLGQNFLVDKAVLAKIIETADLKANDVVLEIGPGLGTLTIELAKRVSRVIAVEKDLGMVEILKETTKDFKNVEIVHGDILKISNFPPAFAEREFPIFNFKFFPSWTRSRRSGTISNYKVVANLPYYIVSPVIRKFLEEKSQPKTMVLMVQKEVAQRICSQPPDMNLLAVSVQFHAESQIISFVSKDAFWPKPEVDSAILKITPLINANKESIDTKLFFRVVKAGFSQPRKQILNNISDKLKIEKEKVRTILLNNGVAPERRAGTLTIEEWLKLTGNFSGIL